MSHCSPCVSFLPFSFLFVFSFLFLRRCRPPRIRTGPHCSPPSADLSFVKSQDLKDQVTQWIKWDTNADDKKELADIIESKDEEKLQHLFRARIRFGTSGLRARMGAGPASMNDLIVQQATQGLCCYLESQEKELEVKKKGIVIGYDARHRSVQFAKITAAVFISRGFRVFLYNRFVATPFVPFGIYHQGAAAGVMVTASHNPKQDNGYKLYWTNGCLIISPHETNITNSIQANLEPWDIAPILAQIDTSGHELLTDPTEEVAKSYFKTISSPPYCWFPEQNAKSTTKITFTPVHGVGQEWVEKAFETFKFPSFVHVEEQKKPDPEFSTVTFPNPEEGKGVLSLAMKAAEANGSYVILANDPDSDRCALAERNKETGAWRIFTGDEIGAIFGSWILSRNIAAGLERDRKDYFVVATAVSSRFLKRIATVEGFIYHETLTGFKFLGNKARDMIDAGNTFLFAYEESIGYLPGPMSLDKDGVRTAAMMAEMAVQLYEADTPNTFGGYLEDLKKKYGYFETCNRYFFCYDPLVMKGIFDAFRTKNNQAYPTHLGDFKIKYIRDLVVGYDNEREGNKPNLPLSSSSPMITLTFEDFEFEGSIYSGCATFRGSGTEPKLKYYVEASGQTGQEQTKKVADKMAKTLIEEVLKPEENNLAPPVE